MQDFPIQGPVTESVPLESDAHGTVRVGSSRVTLETLLDHFDRGMAPEGLVRDFPSLELADVYGAIAYYLKHRAEVNAYRARQAEKGQALRAEIEADPDQAAFRRAVLERLREKDIA